MLAPFSFGQPFAIDATGGLGPELVTNGGFDSDTNWTKGTGWSIASGKASSDGSQTGNSNLVQTGLGLISGKTYLIRFRGSDYSAGTVKAVPNGNVGGALRSSNGFFREKITMPAGGDGNLYMQADVSFVGSIDDVSVRLVE